MADKTPKRFVLRSGYGSSVRAEMIIGEEHNGMTYKEIEKLQKKKGYKPTIVCIIELEDIEKIIMHLVETKGYKIIPANKAIRQKYPRLKINTPILR